MKEGKGENAGRLFYTEKVKLVGALMDGMEAPVVENSYLVQFNSDSNPEQAIAELPAHIKNTIKRAENYEGSKIKTQLEAEKGESTQAGVGSEATVKEEVKPVSEPNETENDDLPF